MDSIFILQDSKDNRTRENRKVHHFFKMVSKEILQSLLKNIFKTSLILKY